jgi:NADH:ubiquinone oxidoreductase subunit 6 (subunit J)
MFLNIKLSFEEIQKLVLEKYNFLEIQKSFSDNLADLLISGLDSTSELAGFCILYNIYFIYFILAGFILLFAMLGSISLCIVK